jgi:hypothetical protein
MRYLQTQDELAWNRTAHLLALIHNVNSKSEHRVEVGDYHPYKQMRKKDVKPAEITPTKRALFSAMQKQFNHGK